MKFFRGAGKARVSSHRFEDPQASHRHGELRIWAMRILVIPHTDRPLRGCVADSYKYITCPFIASLERDWCADGDSPCGLIRSTSHRVCFASAISSFQFGLK